MSTFEEDVVECYFNLKKYFTIKNIPFPAVKPRPGGKGRGEIDLLAVKVGKRGKIKDAIHVEVGVSVSSKFPFVSRTSLAADNAQKLLKKFFKSDCDEKIRQFLPGTQWKNIVISSDFSKKAVNYLEERLRESGARVLRIDECDGEIIVKIRSGKEKGIRITPFSKLLRELKTIFKEESLLTKSFQDPRLRSIQYLVRGRL